MKADFKKIAVPCGYEGGKTKETDLSKAVANILFQQAVTYEQFELGRTIAKEGEAEVTEAEADYIIHIADRPDAAGNIMYYVYAQAVRDYLQKLIEDNKTE